MRQVLLGLSFKSLTLRSSLEDIEFLMFITKEEEKNGMVLMNFFTISALIIEENPCGY